MYKYSDLIFDINHLKNSGIDTGSIGNSELDLVIPYIHVGEYGKKQIFVTGAIHARENITALLVMRQCYHLAFNANALDCGVYFIPMLNPDGAVLIEGADKYGLEHNEKVKRAISLNGGQKDFSLWKANVNGVDLNNNFDARFGLGMAQVDKAAAQGHMGKYPFCQKESMALRNFSFMINPVLSISYHAKGREVYWEFFQNEEDKERDKSIAEAAAKHLGYSLVDGDLGSSGGYKDWCISFLRIPALTIEIIDDKYNHPLDLGLIEEDWEQNKDLIEKLTNYL